MSNSRTLKIERNREVSDIVRRHPWLTANAFINFSNREMKISKKCILTKTLIFQMPKVIHNFFLKNRENERASQSVCRRDAGKILKHYGAIYRWVRKIITNLNMYNTLKT